MLCTKMKYLGLFICVIFSFSEAHVDSDISEWESYKIKFNKTYKSSAEDSRKFEIFRENLKFIRKHNTNLSKTFSLSVNRDIDLGDNELVETRKFEPSFWISWRAKLTFRTLQKRTPNFNKSIKLPESIDWRKLGALNEVQDQYQHELCGACYAFASIAALEAQYFVKTGKLLKLSEQEIVDCSNNYGCYGGWTWFAYDYIMNNGISLAKDYPYQSKEGSCRNKETPRSEVKTYSSGIVANADEIKAALVEFGPIVIYFNSIPKTFRFYKEGIFYDPECTNGFTSHVVVIVGFGKDEKSDTEFWIVRNSWSENWGENGYFRLKMIKDKSYEIFVYSTFPFLDESYEKDNKFIYFPQLNFNLVLYIVAAILVVVFSICCLCILCCKYCKKIRN